MKQLMQEIAEQKIKSGICNIPVPEKSGKCNATTVCVYGNGS
jgi:hypothetical protein